MPSLYMSLVRKSNKKKKIQKKKKLAVSYETWWKNQIDNMIWF